MNTPTTTASPAAVGNDELRLGIRGFEYHDLYDPYRLQELTTIFHQGVESDNPELFSEFKAFAAAKGAGWDPIKSSQILVGMAPYVTRFLAKLFGVEREIAQLKAIVETEYVIPRVKREFIQRRALKKYSADAAMGFDFVSLDASVNALKARYEQVMWTDEELGTAQFIAGLLEEEKSKRDGVVDDLAIVEKWCAARYHQRREEIAAWMLFKIPAPMDFQHLVQVEIPDSAAPNVMQGPHHEFRRRDGFALTDRRYSERQVTYEVEYCVFCHERDRDSCTKGIHDKSGATQKNPVGFELNGCPLHERISEMQFMKSQGDPLAALALVVVDNPMCAGTGHRICNDCMKACIYQKQEPVNIPQIETHVLTDVLGLPYGFEIYSLLTRWNPLNVTRPVALPYNGNDVLVVGLGPAGYTLAHFLLNEGFGVVGIDGLKIEPVWQEYMGGAGAAPKPIRDWSAIYRELDQRVLEGFGGVSEYGITVRWDKNFLTALHIILGRRSTFRMFGGTRFGGTITIDDAWELGFEHIAIATGAGKPTIVSMKNNLIRGIRKASDFLMALQLTGAAKRDSLANLQVQLPAVVIGGGLTGIDTATELMAYYPVQVEKFYERFTSVCAHDGEEAFWSRLDKEEKPIAERFLAHAKEVKSERARAAAAGEKPNFIPLVRKWGGVRLAYRKRMVDAPAYRLNHEEIIKALEEGIYFAEGLSPLEAVPDEFGAVKELIFDTYAMNAQGKWASTGSTTTLPAKCVMVAAGTSPNVIYEREFPGTFVFDKNREFFQGYSAERNADGSYRLRESQDGEIGFFTSYQRDGKFISYYGDNHPVYEGNVVKAMASAKDGYPRVAALFADAIAGAEAELVRGKTGNGTSAASKRAARWNELAAKLDDALVPRVVKVQRLTQTITEVIVHAPYAARHFHPGQFFRLQNYEATAARLDGNVMGMEGLALTGAWVDVPKGLLSMIVLEMGGSSNLVAALTPGEKVVVMGPTGTPTEIPENETVLLLGGGLGNAVLFSIAKALRAKNNRVIYFAGYKKGEDLFKQDEVEEGTDQVIWSTDMGAEIAPRRPQDAHIRANIVQAMLAYQRGELAECKFPLQTVDRIIAIGSDRMMAAVKQARHEALAPYLKDHVAIASINSTMQCMMKEICAQCLQRHVDPVTGKETFVFSCFNQDQIMDSVDFGNLNNRLKANSVQEKLTSVWLGQLLERNDVARV